MSDDLYFLVKTDALGPDFVFTPAPARPGSVWHGIDIQIPVWTVLQPLCTAILRVAARALNARLESIGIDLCSCFPINNALD